MAEYDFIAIDFETATPRMDSACAVGIVAVKDLKPVQRFYSLLRPPMNEFDTANTAIHGIGPEQTATAPTLSELWPDISKFFDEHTPVVAHNPQFDMSVLRMSTDVELPDFVYVNSMDIAAIFVEGSLSLENCAREMNISTEGIVAHNAQDDAWLCAYIAVKGMVALGCLSLWELLAKQPINRRSFSELTPTKAIGGSRRKPSTAGFRVKDLQPCAEGSSGDGPLCGKSVVFTGVLSLERTEAAQLAVNAGAKVKTGVSKLTDILVVGKQDTALVGADGMSAKEEKAHALNGSGAAQIRIISEEEFLSLIGIK